LISPSNPEYNQIHHQWTGNRKVRQMDEHNLVISQLSRECEIDGHTVKVEIYGSGKKDWILEVLDADGNSTVWDSKFETDGLAFQEFQRTIEEEGIDSVIGPPD